MKLLWIPLDAYKHKENDKLFGSILRALQSTCDARIYGEDDNFIPDAILYQGGLTPESLRELKNKYLCKVFMYTGDVRYYPQKSLTDYKRVVDVYFLPQNDRFLNINTTIFLKNIEFLWEPIQDWRFMPPQDIDSGKIVFVGNNYDTVPGRADTINFIRKHCPDVEVYGSGWGEDVCTIDNELVPALYNKAYAVICENNWSDICDYFTPRDIGTMAAGGCPIIKKRKFNSNEGMKVAMIGIDYSNKYESLDAIEVLRNNPDIRNQLARESYKTALRYFTPAKWAEKVISLIKKYNT